MKTQRIIKFRVWDEKYRCWVNNSFLLYPKEEIKIQGRILTQFTGLKDKNGKEIYEGDILKIIWYENTILFGEVKWNLSDLTYTVFGKNVATYLTLLNNIEIFGNTFENSKLLNEKI